MGTILKNGINYSGSGGGGVSSYNELTDKPSIEGVTLSGSKTASDLGLAKASDIPSTDTCYTTADSAETSLADGDYFPFQDVSANGRKKTLWSNIKSVLKTYFDTLYSTTKTRGTATSGGTTLSLVNTGDMYTWNNKQSALTAGTNITISGTTINSVGSTDLTFSTSERAVGKWIDNSTIYQKTINFGNLPNSTGKYVAHGISGTFTIISFDAFVYSPTSAEIQTPICYYQVDNSTHAANTFINVFRDVNGINIRAATDVSSFKAYITIRYIKKQLT